MHVYEPPIQFSDICHNIEKKSKWSGFEAPIADEAGAVTCRTSLTWVQSAIRRNCCFLLHKKMGFSTLRVRLYPMANTLTLKADFFSLYTTASSNNTCDERRRSWKLCVNSDYLVLDKIFDTRNLQRIVLKFITSTFRLVCRRYPHLYLPQKVAKEQSFIISHQRFILRDLKRWGRGVKCQQCDKLSSLKGDNVFIV